MQQSVSMAKSSKRGQRRRRKPNRAKLILLTVSAIATVAVVCCERTEVHTAEAATDIELVVHEAEEVSNAQAVAIYPVPLDEDLQLFIIRSCEARHIDPAVVMAMIEKESSYTASAVGDGGDSLGLMQIQPRWHSERMLELGCEDLLNPYQNVTVGIDILATLSETGKPIEWVLMAYNGGVKYAYKKEAAGEVSSYAKEVLQISNRLKEGVQMFYSDNPVADFEAWDAEQNEKLAQLPVCVDCGEHIQQETAVFLGGEWYCDSCIDAYRRDVDCE